MKNYILQIELQSDLCVSDGGAYNSALDTDICYTSEGFPCIPAKRIKGCLRECASELNDWGFAVRPEDLFGSNGDAKGKVRIGDALIKNYDSFCDEIREAQDSLAAPLVHPQNVLRLNTAIRTQTSIDYETGVADDASLRTMRVANRGLVFESKVSVNDNAAEELELCVKLLRHMGIARTRGLGEVEASMIPDTTVLNKKTSDFLKDGATVLHYAIKLKEPVICKSIAGGESRTQDYIEGSKVLGLIAERLREQNVDYQSFMDAGELFCSNAYFYENGIRYTEVPASLFSVKNSSSEYRNKLYEKEDTKETAQISTMKHCYVNETADGLVKKSVALEERYHHSRPEDKGIGRANNKDGSQFYQMSSICAGQAFSGRIHGSVEQIRKIYELLQDSECYIGFGRMSEYGRCEIEVLSTETESVSEVTTDEAVVKLEAPAILYGDKATPTVDTKTLIAECIAVLGLKKEDLDTDRCRVFAKFSKSGGFNVTWKKRKPTIPVFDKGTVVQLFFKQQKSLRVTSELLLGERISEGYGEASLHFPKNEKTGYFGKIKENDSIQRSQKEYTVKKGGIVDQFAKQVLVSELELDAAEQAEAKAKSFGETIGKPTVSNMMIMWKESNDAKKGISGIRNMADARYGNKTTGVKDKKLDMAEKLLELTEKRTTEVINCFRQTYGLKEFETSADEMQMKYLNALLRELKYVWHHNIAKNGGDLRYE